MVTRYRVRTLLVFAILQCVLYGINLKLLPMWGDETFTVVTVAETPAHILQSVREDIHPPLYFLLAHWWNRIPISADPLVRLRALSVLFALLTTVFLDRRWLRSAPVSLRNWFLLFWVLSPCLLLYAAWLGLTACRCFWRRWRSGTCCAWQKMPLDGKTWQLS